MQAEAARRAARPGHGRPGLVVIAIIITVRMGSLLPRADPGAEEEEEDNPQRRAAQHLGPRVRELGAQREGRMQRGAVRWSPAKLDII